MTTCLALASASVARATVSNSPLLLLIKRVCCIVHAWPFHNHIVFVLFFLLVTQAARNVFHARRQCEHATLRTKLLWRDRQPYHVPLTGPCCSITRLEHSKEILNATSGLPNERQVPYLRVAMPLGNNPRSLAYFSVWPRAVLSSLCTRLVSDISELQYRTSHQYARIQGSSK